MNTWIWIAVILIALVALAVIFRKHLKKIGIGIGIILAGWFGIQGVEEIPDNSKEPIEVNDSTEVENPEAPKIRDTIGEVFEITLSEEIDQTLELQKQIDAIPDGEPDNWNVIEFPEGRFWTEGVNIGRTNKGIIDFIDRHYLIIKGGKFYTKAPGSPFGGHIGSGDYSHRRHIWIENSSNLEFIKTRVEGSNTIEGSQIGSTAELTPAFWKGGSDSGSNKGYPAYKPYWEFEHAFAIEASENITLRDCEAYGVWGDGVCIGGYPPISSRNIKVLGGSFNFVGRQGVAIYHAENVLIDGIKALQGRRAAIDVENYHTTGISRNITIQNSTLEPMQTVFAAIGNGLIDGFYIYNNKYKTNGSTFAGYDSLKKTRRKNLEFIGNERVAPWSFGSKIASIRAEMWDGVLIKDNIELISSSQSKTSCYFKECTDVKVLDNDFGQGDNIISIDSEIEVNNNTPKQEIR